MKPSKEVMVGRLLDDWINNAQYGYYEGLKTVLTTGWKGYDNMTYEEVRKEYIDADLASEIEEEEDEE